MYKSTVEAMRQVSRNHSLVAEAILIAYALRAAVVDCFHLPRGNRQQEI